MSQKLLEEEDESPEEDDEEEEGEVTMLDKENVLLLVEELNAELTGTVLSHSAPSSLCLPQQVRYSFSASYRRIHVDVLVVCHISL